MNRYLCLLIAALFLFSGSASTGWPAQASAACAIAPPSTVSIAAFDKLQLPVSRNNAGRPDTISGGALRNYSSEFMRRSAGALIFRVPTGALVTTANSKFPRSELHEGSTWRYTDGCAALAATVEIDALPGTGKIVIGQIHQERDDGQAPRPVVLLFYDNGSIRADVLKQQTAASGQPRLKLQLANGIGLRVPFTYSLVVAKGGLLIVTVNGDSRSLQLDPSFEGARLYFKAGNYTQDTQGGSEVRFLGLNVEHN